MGNKALTLFLKESLCTSDLLSTRKIFIESHVPRRSFEKHILENTRLFAFATLANYYVNYNVSELNSVFISKLDIWINENVSVVILMQFI